MVETAPEIAYGWKLNAFIPRTNRDPVCIHYLVAIPDQKDAITRLSRSAHVARTSIEVVGALTEEALLDFGLETGEITEVRRVD